MLRERLQTIILEAFGSAEKSGGEIGVHPLDSTATVWLEADALVALIRKHGNFVYYLGF